MNPAATPVPQEDVEGDGRWISMHKRFLAEAKEREPEVLFIGDSLIERLQYFDVWEKMFVPLHCLNFGISRDETQHILWRIQNGELDNLSPKVIVILCGTNNHKHTAGQITEGIVAIIKSLHEKQPQAQVVVMSIPPRGQAPNPLREKIAEINHSLADLIPDMELTQFVEIDPVLFYASDGESLNHLDMHDYLHLTQQGYQKMMEPVLEELQMLLRNYQKADAVSMGDDS